MVAVINSIESPICCIDCPKCCLKDETFNPLHPLKLVTLQLDLIPPVNMRTEALEKRLLKIICIILAMIGPWKAFSAPQLPEPEFSWKNVAVDGKKTAVFCIFRDSRGIMWLGTNSGLYFYDGITTHPVGETEIFGTQVYSIVEKDNRLFIGSNNGLLTYDYASGQVIESDIDSPKEQSRLSNMDWKRFRPYLCVRLIPQNSMFSNFCHLLNGHILIGTDDGVFDMSKECIKHYRHDSRRELSLADNEIWCIYSDSQNNVWAGHERGFSIASNSNYLRTIELSALAHSGEGNEIHSIYRDTKDNLWFAGNNGVIRLSYDSTPHWYRHTDLPNSLSHNRVRAIHEDAENNIWFATDAGINRLNRKNDTFDVFYIVDKQGEHNSNWVYALIEDDTHFWIGSFLNGLHYVDKKKFNSSDRTIVSDMSINAENKSLELSNNLVNDVVKDQGGNIWILLFRDNTLTKFSPTSNKVIKYDIFDLTGGYPTNISSDNQGRIWCAFKGGVIIFSENDKYDIVKFPHTNSDETVLALGKVGNGMWISTQSNVWNINGLTLEANLLPIPQKSYTAVYEDTLNNKVYLGGTDEILEVANNITDNSTDYKTIRMVLNDRGEGHLNLSDIKGGTNGMTIPYGGNITLVISSLDYSPESVHRYMYKLAESPTDTIGGWIVMPEGTNIITFSDLKMGEYNVLVKAVGSPMDPIAVPLKVKSPWALSWWAIMAYISIAIVVIYWIVWYMRKKNSRTLQEQERQSALENVERKLSFLSTISHDLKTPLSMILGPVSLMKEKTKDPENKKNLEVVYDNAVRLNNMIHRTLELQHLEDTDENLLILSIFDAVEFCKGVFEIFKENNPQKNFIFHSSVPQILIEADAVKFESVITNLLSNACKYSDDGATISFGISPHEDHVEIVVSDDGVGISDIDQPLVFQRMFRAPSTSKLKEGTGLGLYLIKKIS